MENIWLKIILTILIVTAIFTSIGSVVVITTFKSAEKMIHQVIELNNYDY